ncbi:hypothetical protein O181_071104 [Austropuccinia psidii MF-1]|uniref:Uncharacterized protein n=1 Tax=Austropuccinia psidii MF-1 TaxID=1389203 RepID=A0A9Q3F247_9BASI|nr:hypothetical protein [Austropuccinia psidii MF-1]
MPNPIDVSASSMTGLLGAVEASKAANAYSRQSLSQTRSTDSADDYNLSRFKKGSAVTKVSSTKKVSNKGVKIRDAKDKLHRKATQSVSMTPSVQEQLAMEALERKTKIYEATIRGEKGGLSEQQLEACPLDVDAKRANLELPGWKNRSVSDDEENQNESAFPGSSTSATFPPSFSGRLGSAQDSFHAPSLGEQAVEEEEWIESKDEFGRDILVPCSQVKPTILDPQRTMAFSQTESARHLQEISAEYGPQTSFPTLETSNRPAKKQPSEEPLEKYFDPKAERRQLGTGFYALSSNPEERKRQQEELRAREAQTEQARLAKSSEAPKELTASEIAIETRKRQIQLKREELARKRMKKVEATTTDAVQS